MALPNEMLAARAHQGSTELYLEKIPIPKPGPIEVLVKVASAGLAPGVFANLQKQSYLYLPTTLGHEIAGTIVSVGNDVTSAAPGDRVRVHANVSCQLCKYCLSDREQMCAQGGMMGFLAFGNGPMPLYEKYHDGGLAEFIKVPYWLLDPISPAISFDVAAKVQDLACAVRALKCADLKLGATIIVTAATGSMGVSTLKLAEFFPVSRLILVARSSQRLKAVQHLSKVPTEIVPLEDLGEWHETKALSRRLRELAPDGADAIIDYMPNSAGANIWQVMGGLAFGGALVHMGGNGAVLPLPVAALMKNCWRVIGTRGNTRSDTRFVLDRLNDGSLNVDELISHRFPLCDLKQAVTALTQRSPPMWMGVINP